MHWPRVVYNLAILTWTLVAAGAQALSDDGAVPNKPILLISNSELGQANVLLAASQSLLSDYPSAEIHYASFPSISGAVSAASQRVSTSAGARPITFHPLNGTTYVDKIAEQGFQVRDLPHRPGLLGAATALKDAATLLLPWNGPEHVDIYEEIRRVIGSVDPGLVVVDSMFAPAHDAVIQTQVKHVVLAPNSMRDFIFTEQPQGEAMWKFPVMGSAFPYPLPWHLIPSNFLVWARMFSNVISSFYFGRMKELTAYRKSHGIQDPVDLLHPIMGTSTMLIASSPEIEYPMVIPSNVLPCGPIVSQPESLSAIDPDLASWLASCSTVVVNLGSHAEYDYEKVQRFARMVIYVLARSDVQILWKIDRSTAQFPSDTLSVLEHDITHRRLRIVDWIPGDVSSLLHSGRIVCAVHHGGASSFHEPLAAGVPQVILPLWLDTYDYAVQAEWLGVGIWGNRENAPLVHEDELTHAVLKVICCDHEDGRSIRRKAKEVAAGFSRPGRDVAAEYILRALRSENQTTFSGRDTDTTVRDEL